MIYLDNAATSHPKPDRVYARVEEFLRGVGANPGRGSHRMAVEAEACIASVRRSLAEMFGCREPSRIIFTLNATDALNMALKGVLASGDHVVTTVLEHNSVARPLERMEREGRIRVTRLEPGPDGAIDPDRVEGAITPATRLVVIGHAGNVLGTVQPIREIGAIVRRRGGLFAVDAAQSAGIIPIDVEEDRIDLLAFTGHKTLMGPQGTGGLVVGERVEPAPWREGGTGGDSANPLQPDELPHRLEAGTPNTAGIAGLGEGVRYVRENSGEMARHETALASRLWEALEGRRGISLHGHRPGDGRPRTGVVSFTMAGHTASEVGAILDSSFGIAVRAGLHCAPGTHR
ncbi:MAG: aminotransferase class V-fold PLP-dependent enzyme, partial [Actinomycetota bacterium]